MIKKYFQIKEKEVKDLNRISEQIIKISDDFIAEAIVYTEISKINVENRRLMISFTNGLTFDCGIVSGDYPVFRYTSAGIEYKYSTETDNNYKVLLPVEDFGLSFDSLTEEQINKIKFKFSDLTPEEIEVFQSPAIEASKIAKTALQKLKEFENEISLNDKERDKKLEDKVDCVDGKGLSECDFTKEDKTEVAKIKNKVDTVKGKTLSTNDYTNEDKSLLQHISSFDPDIFYNELAGKLSLGQVYSKEEINTKLEEVRISLNLTPEQLSSLNVNLTPIQNELKEINLFPIKGKKMLVLGDSLSSAGGGSMEIPAVGSWCQYTKTLLNLSGESRVIANGGATCTDKSTTTIKTNKVDWGGDNNVLSNQVYSVINHYKTYKGTASEFAPDVIAIMIGTNNSHTTNPDPMWSSIVGDWKTCMYSQFIDTDYDLYDLSDGAQLQKYNTLRDIRKKFYSAYRWAIEALLYWFPNTSIYILSPMANSGGRGQNVFENTVKACKKVADFLSCGYIDVHNRSGLSYYSNTRKDNGWDSQWYTFDGTHPNFDAGMELVGRYVAKELQNQYFTKPPIKSIKVPMSTTDVYYNISIVNANADMSFGTTNPVDSTQVIKGGSLTVDIVPASGYEIYSVKIDGVEQGKITSYIFKNVQANHEIIVEFCVKSVDPPIEKYMVSASSNNIDYGTVTPTSQEVIKGGTATMTANAKNGYVIESWAGVTSGNGVGTMSGTGTVTNVQANKEVICNFKANTPDPPATDKTILSLNWGFNDNGAVEDGITKVYLKNTAAVNSDIPIGKICLNGKGALNYANTIGATTGNDSGIYPDKFLERGVLISGGTTETNNGYLTISDMENGLYKIGILTNISSKAVWSSYISDPSGVLIDINSIQKNPTKIIDNTNTLTIFENVVVENGILSIKFDISQTNMRCMINVIEIEKIA